MRKIKLSPGIGALVGALALVVRNILVLAFAPGADLIDRYEVAAVLTGALIWGSAIGAIATFFARRVLRKKYPHLYDD